MKKKAVTYEGIFAAVERLLSERPYIVAAIDGRCGSGKTTLADSLAKRFAGRIIHTDDFYLPPEARQEGWERTAGANMDFERLRLEAVLPAAQGKLIVYRPYRCQGARAKAMKNPGGENGLSCADAETRASDTENMPQSTLSQTPLTVVEGSYSEHPLLADCYDLKIFLTCSQEVQRARLKCREKERYDDF